MSGEGELQHSSTIFARRLADLQALHQDELLVLLLQLVDEQHLMHPSAQPCAPASAAAAVHWLACAPAPHSEQPAVKQQLSICKQ